MTERRESTLPFMPRLFVVLTGAMVIVWLLLLLLALGSKVPVEAILVKGFDGLGS